MKHRRLKSLLARHRNRNRNKIHFHTCTFWRYHNFWKIIPFKDGRIYKCPWPHKKYGPYNAIERRDMAIELSDKDWMRLKLAIIPDRSLYEKEESDAWG